VFGKRHKNWWVIQASWVFQKKNERATRVTSLSYFDFSEYATRLIPRSAQGAIKIKQSGLKWKHRHTPERNGGAAGAYSMSQDWNTIHIAMPANNHFFEKKQNKQVNRLDAWGWSTSPQSSRGFRVYMNKIYPDDLQHWYSNEILWQEKIIVKSFYDGSILYSTTGSQYRDRREHRSIPFQEGGEDESRSRAKTVDIVNTKRLTCWIRIVDWSEEWAFLQSSDHLH